MIFQLKNCLIKTIWEVGFYASRKSSLYSVSFLTEIILTLAFIAYRSIAY